jgi:hypothetical protein
MIMGFFSTAKSDELADWIVGEVKRAVPTDPASRKTKKKHAIRAQGIDATITRRVADFLQTNRLNIYTKARLASRVSAGLSAHGYSETFIKALSLELIQLVETAKKKRPG